MVRNRVAPYYDIPAIRQQVISSRPAPKTTARRVVLGTRSVSSEDMLLEELELIEVDPTFTRSSSRASSRASSVGDELGTDGTSEAPEMELDEQEYSEDEVDRLEHEPQVDDELNNALVNTGADTATGRSRAREEQERWAAGEEVGARQELRYTADADDNVRKREVRVVLLLRRITKLSPSHLKFFFPEEERSQMKRKFNEIVDETCTGEITEVMAREMKKLFDRVDSIHRSVHRDLHARSSQNTWQRGANSNIVLHLR